MKMTEAQRQEIRSRYEAIRWTLNERMHRLWAATEAKVLGHGGVTALLEITALPLKTGASDACRRIGPTIRVSHFPPGTSKWNKIEHRLFSRINTNGKGIPLTSHEVVVNLIANTQTRKGYDDTEPLASRFGRPGRGDSEQEVWKKKGNAGSKGGRSERNF